MNPRTRRTEEGAVTAETALSLPVITLFALSLAWLLGIGLVQVRAIDAARETARFAARGESRDRAVGVGLQVASDGSRITISRGGSSDDELVRVRVSSPVPGPAGLFEGWSGLRVRAEAVAVAEPTAGTS